MMRRAGVAQSVRMAMTGHSTPEMDNRYDTVDEQDKRAALDRMTASLESVSRDVSKSWN
jgi:hypothetical protein